MNFWLGMLVAYLLIGVLQLIINTFATGYEAPLYLTCFWLLPLLELRRLKKFFRKFKKLLTNKK